MEIKGPVLAENVLGESVLAENALTESVLIEEVLTAREVLLAGAAEGEVLRLERPLSFWGGVDPNSGEVTDPRHPQFGASMAGRIVAMERGIGSSSGSSILLELLANGNGPIGLLLIEPDAILTLAAVVAREMGYADLPIFLITEADFGRLPTRLRMTATGALEVVE